MPNIWGAVPRVVEMQSEGGAAGAVHGALQGGALTTTFTASQGLLLMIPNMYKIAGELTSAVIHVAARSVAAQALSIFGDHSDVYAARQTGFALLASCSVQEAHDFALVAQAATLRTRVPFLHFFDGFRTSHEVAQTWRLEEEDLHALLDPKGLDGHRDRALTPDRPCIRGTAQNPDVFFQARESVNPFYDVCPDRVQEVMDQFAERTGRHYHLFDYVGHPEAERVIILMGSGAEAAHETVDWLVDHGERVGVLKVRLYRPFDTRRLVQALPPTTKAIAVLDRTKEPGAPGEPLYLDVVCALSEARAAGESPFQAEPMVVGGRYGLSSKEFNPGMVKSVFDALSETRPPNHFTVGIFDDVTHTSLAWDDDFDVERDDVTRALFFGLGADGTVSANKNSIKIIGDQTDNWAQGHFVYDSKKSGAITISHLRFGPRPLKSTYLIRKASFIGCHQWTFLDRFDVLQYAAPGAVFLLNTHHGPDEVWAHLPQEVQAGLIEKGLSFYVIDGYKVARDAGMAGRINTVMQTCFFAISGMLPRDEAIAHIKAAIQKTYGAKGDAIVRMNFNVVDQALNHLHQVEVPAEVSATHTRPPVVPDTAPDFVRNVTARIIAGEGDLLPVSCFPPDGTWPTGTTRWEKRTIAEQIPQWDPKLCIQCNKCALVCPHAAIRVKVASPGALDAAPDGFRHAGFRSRELKGHDYTIQVAPEDCTGCTLCAVVCPAKDKANPRHKAIDMAPLEPHLERERACYEFFLDLPEMDRAKVKRTAKESQLLQPLFEYSGACAGCGETPYIKLVSQLFGDRMLIANATGCSSIYGGNLPCTPYAQNADGRGPAWSNSLFEDNAEFGLGFRLAVEQLTSDAQRLLTEMKDGVGAELADAILDADQGNEQGIGEQRERVEQLREVLGGLDHRQAPHLDRVADYLVRKSVWIVGGDGWAYDIGYGGLDHALASGLDVNILVVAKFAAGGKPTPKKDLGLLAMSYGNVFVAQIALGANDAQATRALVEAESYPGPSLVIAYSPCIAHGYNLNRGLDQQSKAVKAGYWPLYRFDPRNEDQGKPALKLDSKAPKLPVSEFAYTEARFRILQQANPERARRLMSEAQAQVEERYARYLELTQTGKD
jgi:pyruvate-ferredoxin/flavodoxin oxidoreductase